MSFKVNKVKKYLLLLSVIMGSTFQLNGSNELFEEKDIIFMLKLQKF